MSTRIYTGYVDMSDPIVTISAAKTLKDSDHGKTFLLNAAAGAAITLPAVKPGLKFKFIVDAAFATTAWTIVTPGGVNIIQGGVDVNSTLVPFANEDTITFVASAETIGDFVHLECDGTDWNASGLGTASGAITGTAA